MPFPIAAGCPLSPLIGAFFLNALDAAAATLGLFYVRFMDDILILAHSGTNPLAPARCRQGWSRRAAGVGRVPQ